MADLNDKIPIKFRFTEMFQKALRGDATPSIEHAHLYGIHVSSWLKISVESFKRTYRPSQSRSDENVKKHVGSSVTKEGMPLTYVTC